jgi:DNA-binding NtrC family response regulator
MPLDSSTRYAAVIEPHHPLAERVAKLLRKRGYVVGIAATHASAAAWAASRQGVGFLVASPPAQEENCEGSYLTQSRVENPSMGVVVMLAEGHAHVRDVPPNAVKIGKPFSLLELAAAIDKALVAVGVVALP